MTPLETAAALLPGYVAAGARYYDISTTAEYSSPVTVCFPYDTEHGRRADPPAPLRRHDLGRRDPDQRPGQRARLRRGRQPVAVRHRDRHGDRGAGYDDRVRAARHDRQPGRTFEFSSNDPFATFECLLDDPTGLSWGSCDFLHEIEDLTIGSHELRVRAENALGLVDATPAVHRWTVVLPETTIDTAPPLSTMETFAFFTFSSNDPLATFECSLDGAAVQRLRRAGPR